ncbi:MAG: hypothetical protein Q8N98_03090, partial [bacterium]|nr:hypothetical protein [bacterium]
AVIVAHGILIAIRAVSEKKRFLADGIMLAVLIGFLVSLMNFWRIYTTDYRRDFSFAWQYGYREAADYLKKRTDIYEKVVFTKKYGEPHEFMLFYLKYPPEKYHEESDKRTDFHADWYWVDGFGKFEFVNDWDMPLKTKNLLTEGKRTLVFTSPNNYTAGGVKLGTINFLNETPAFDIVEYK